MIQYLDEQISALSLLDKPRKHQTTDLMITTFPQQHEVKSNAFKLVI